MPASKHSTQGLGLPLLLMALFEIAGTVNILSQTYFFDNYSTQQGFESKVYSIIQDKQNYVWLGTQTGVSKFDGNTFLSCSVENGLAPGGVRVLFMDRNNVLWMGHEGGGITRYNGKSFERISQIDTLIHSNITSICQDHDSQLWITTELDGALRIKDPREPAALLKFEHYLKGKSLGDQVFNSLVTSNGDLYFVTNVGIRKYNKAGNSFENFAPDGLFTYFPTSIMYEDRKGRVH
jgi:ligand-binding sensor domain-containing protein